MPVIETIAAAKALITLASKAMDLFPNYEQRKKERFHQISLEIAQEKAKQRSDQDDDLLMNLRDEQLAIAIHFAQELDASSKGISK